MDLERFSFCDQVSAFSSLVGGLRYVLTRDRITIIFLVSSVVHVDFFLVISYMPTHVVGTCLHQDAHVSPILICCVVENPSEVVPSFPFNPTLNHRSAKSVRFCFEDVSESSNAETMRVEVDICVQEPPAASNSASHRKMCLFSLSDGSKFRRPNRASSLGDLKTKRKGS